VHAVSEMGDLVSACNSRCLFRTSHREVGAAYERELASDFCTGLERGGHVPWVTLGFRQLASTASAHFTLSRSALEEGDVTAVLVAGCQAIN